MTHTPGPWHIGSPLRRCTIEHQPGGGGHGTGACLYEQVGWDIYSPFQIYQDKEYPAHYGHAPDRAENGCIVGYTDYEVAGVITLDNAQLIAAAPDLLAALKAALNEAPSWRFDAKVAIAKAEEA